jgi:hypothetical protein
MFALAFAGMPSPVGIDDESGTSKKMQTRNRGVKGGGEVAKLFMKDESLLAGETRSERTTF